ncbi:23S rRNA (uracil(1939)-C(5))-methyltransferase RlmD [Marinobacterium sp. BA1]|uniref:23S rRNA (uracil(1939)-C(5))-methyltransferase RlmD n=1 Tax=Marinobacterium sp. BA1 TaxID=3138931 RepID=UPI0034E84ED1
MSRKQIQFGAPRRSKKAVVSDTPLELTVDRLSHEGRGIASHNGKTTFIAGVLPGERVQVRLTQVHKRYDEAELLQVTHPSLDRREPACAHFNQCGGCDLQHLNIDAQRLHKQQQVLDQLKRYAGVDIQPEQLFPTLTAAPLGYRRTARIGLNQRQRDGELLVGFRRRGSNKLLNIDQCPILEPRLQPVFDVVRQHLSDATDVRQLTHIDLSHGDRSGFICFRATRSPSAELMQRLQAIADALQLQLIVALNDATIPADPAPCHYSLPEFELELAFGSSDFIQVNADLNRLMVRQAVDWMDPGPEERVLDLFCGLGNFTLPLAQKAAQVVGIEGSSDMVAQAQRNAASAGLDNAQFYRANLSESFVHAPWYRSGFDLILLDPPRTGAREAVQQLAGYGARKVLYISCNPSALVADLPLLLQAGYRVARFGIMDIFPQTSHVESMLLLERTP